LPALRIKQEAPSLADLVPDQLEMTQRLAAELNTAVNLAGIDYQAERETFLTNAGRTGSAHTRRRYRTALARLEAFTERAHISPLELTPARADDFIYSLYALRIPSLEDLAKTPPNKIYRRGIGQKTFEVIRAALKSNGIASDVRGIPEAVVTQ
jgi:hypothetical protein